MRIKVDTALVAQNFTAFKDNPALHESAQLFEKGLPIAEMVQAFAINRNVLSSFAAFDSIYPHGNLERGILEKVILCISERNHCQFCVNSHLDITRDLGIANNAATDPSAGGHSYRERLAIEYALMIHKDSNRVPEELYHRLHSAFTDSELVELTFLVGFINMLNWFNNALGVQYRSEFESVKIS